MIDEREATQANFFGNNDGFGALFDDLEESLPDGFRDLAPTNLSNPHQTAKPSAGDSDFRDDSLSRNAARQTNGFATKNHNRMDEELPDLAFQHKAFKDEQRKTIFAPAERVEPSRLPSAESRLPPEASEFRSYLAANISRMPQGANQPSFAAKAPSDAPKPPIALAKPIAPQPALPPKSLPQTLVCPKYVQNQPAGHAREQAQAPEPKQYATAITVGLKPQPHKPENALAKIPAVSLMNIARPAVDGPVAKPELFKPSMPTLTIGAQPLKQMQTLINFAAKLTPALNGLTAVQKEHPAFTKPYEAANFPPASAKLVKSNAGTTFAIQSGKPAAPVLFAGAGVRTANNQQQSEGKSR